MAASSRGSAVQPLRQDAPSEYAPSARSKRSAKSSKSANRLSLRRIFGRKDAREGDDGDESKRSSYYQDAPPVPPLPQANLSNHASNGYVTPPPQASLRKQDSGGYVTTKSAMERHLNRSSSGARGLANGGGKKKQLIMSAFVEMCSGHQSPGLWRHPDDESHRFNDVKHWMELAKTLEAAKFHCMFIADVLGGYDVYGGPKNLDPSIQSGAQWPVNEPLSVIPAMAAVTESISFGVTVSTTYEQPYHLARRLSTVDHLTNGRVGWNVVTGYLDSAARNLGRKEQPDHEERYSICEEYMAVTYKLWQSSWRDGAVVRNRRQGIYTHPDRVREINHKGKYFEVPGPHICQPSPQRTPVIMQAGTSKSGKAFAARHAEAIFVSGHSPPAVAKNIREIREQAAKEGRDPQSIKFLAKICPILGETREEAEAKYREYLSYGSEEGALALFGGWTGVDMAQYGEDEELRYVESNAIRSYIEGLMKTQPKAGKWTKKTLAEHVIVGGLGATPVGTPSEVADEFERWVEEADVDGFNIAYAIMPQTFIDVAELLMPELRRRGLFWDDYAVPEGTWRENLYCKPGQEFPLPDHPASKYLWQAGQSKDTPIWEAKTDAVPPAPQAGEPKDTPKEEAKIDGVSSVIPGTAAAAVGASAVVAATQYRTQSARDSQDVATAQPPTAPKDVHSTEPQQATDSNGTYFDQADQTDVPRYRAATPPPPGFAPGPVPGAWVRNPGAIPLTPSTQSVPAGNGSSFTSLNAVANRSRPNSSSKEVTQTAPRTSKKPFEQIKPSAGSFSLGPAWANVRDDAQPDGIMNPSKSHGENGRSGKYEGEQFYDTGEATYRSVGNGAADPSTTKSQSRAPSNDPEDLMARIMEFGADDVLRKNGYIDPTAVQFA